MKTGSQKWSARISIAGTYITVDSTTDAVVGTWAHLVMIADGATLKLYVNGVEEGSVAAVGAFDTADGGYNQPRFPQYGNNDAINLACHIAEPAIYHTLGAARPAAHFAAA